jgi:hypothetical protein
VSSLNGLAPQEIAESVEVDGLPGCLAETNPPKMERPDSRFASVTWRRELSISEITSGLNSRPSQSWTVMVEAMNPELPPVDTWS